MVAPKLKLGMDEAQFAELLAKGDEIGLKFELTDGGITWETYPGVAHQEIVFGIQTSVNHGTDPVKRCDCYQGADVHVVLPDGTVKRPDISIWCKKPSELESFVHEIPEVVIEVVCPGYEDKDLVHGPPVYLRNGVRDVVVFDRQRGEVHLWTSEGKKVVASPAAIELQCGCRITV